jgi:hypothetical protein
VVADGLGNKNRARINLSEHTVKFHIRSILENWAHRLELKPSAAGCERLIEQEHQPQRRTATKAQRRKKISLSFVPFVAVLFLTAVDVRPYVAQHIPELGTQAATAPAESTPAAPTAVSRTDEGAR